MHFLRERISSQGKRKLRVTENLKLDILLQLSPMGGNCISQSNQECFLPRGIQSY
jgi:hypothetical protein